MNARPIISSSTIEGSTGVARSLAGPAMSGMPAPKPRRIRPVRVSKSTVHGPSAARRSASSAGFSRRSSVCVVASVPGMTVAGTRSSAAMPARPAASSTGLRATVGAAIAAIRTDVATVEAWTRFMGVPLGWGALRTRSQGWASTTLATSEYYQAGRGRE